MDGQQLLLAYTEWLWDESEYMNGYDPITRWPGWPRVQYEPVVSEFLRHHSDKETT